MNLPVLAILALFALAVVVFGLVKSGRRESTSVDYAELARRFKDLP